MADSHPRLHYCTNKKVSNASHGADSQAIVSIVLFLGGEGAEGLRETSGRDEEYEHQFLSARVY